MAPESSRADAPSARLAAPASSRSSASSRNLAERAALARNTNSRVTAARDQLTGKAARAEAATRSLRDLAGRDPAAAERYQRVGTAVTQASGVAISVGVSVALGCYWGDWYGYCDPYGWCAPYYGYPYWGYGYWWGYGGYGYSWFCNPFAPAYWYWFGCWPYSINAWYPNCYSYGYWPSSYYSSVIYAQAEPVQEVVEVVEEEPAPQAEFVGEGVAQSTDQARLNRLLMPGPDSAARASGQYLTLGDRAFREGRFADAVHFYARAVEFAPEEGVLYLVLSDGLFATGDYHYGAFALRRALEIDPTLASSGIDKHEFYLDGREFDRQLAQLENYLVDRPGDDDARLMLAANYLFGGRPSSAVDLLGSSGSERVRDEPAGALILEAARRVQYGTPAVR